MKTITISGIEFGIAEDDGTVCVHPFQVDPVTLASATQKLVKRLSALKRRAEARRKESARRAAKKAALKERKSKKRPLPARPELEQIPLPLDRI